MQLSAEVQQLVRSTSVVREDELIRELSAERAEIAARLAAKGLVSSSVRVHQDIDAIETFIKKRMTSRLNAYLDTFAALGIKLDLLLEAEIARELEAIANSKHTLTGPPGLSIPSAQSMRETYSSRLDAANSRALSEAKNRLRLERLKAAVEPALPSPASIVTHNYNAEGPNARINIHSTDNSSNVVTFDVPEMLDNIVKLSLEQGSHEIQQAANEVKARTPTRNLPPPTRCVGEPCDLVSQSDAPSSALFGRCLSLARTTALISTHDSLGLGYRILGSCL